MNNGKTTTEVMPMHRRLQQKSINCELCVKISCFLYSYLVKIAVSLVSYYLFGRKSDTIT